MTKNEFMEYVDYLGRLFGFTPTKDRDILLAWYKPFEKVHIDIAREMAQLYVKEETGRFKLAKLLEYKEVALRGKVYKENIKNCKLCKNVGFVILEKRENGRIYEFCNRCICNIGQSLNSNIKTVTEVDLMERYRDYNDVYRFEKQEFETIDLQEFKKEKIGGFI